MIRHQYSDPTVPSRVVLLGASGVIGRVVTSYLQDKGVPTLALRSTDLNLLTRDAADRLALLLNPQDVMVMLACLTPDRGRDLGTMTRNIQMAINICEAVKHRSIAHLIYLSSDAVYPRSIDVITEDSPTEATDGYAAMHLVREKLFCQLMGCPVAILRCTQVYAHDDTHNAYGPCRFYRTASAEGQIVLFGNGEDTRDHIAADDVAALIHLCLAYRSQGVLNVATGESVSFAEIARIIADGTDPRPSIISVPRQSRLTHRRFNIAACVKAFPGFVYTPIDAGLRSMFCKPGVDVISAAKLLR